MSAVVASPSSLAAPTAPSSSSSATPSSSRLPDSTSSAKKRKMDESHDDEDDDDEENDLDESSSASNSPSKAANTGGRRKASDEERKARLEARQARNRLSAQYSRERKKAYMEQLEGSINALKTENTLLRQQRDQDQLVRQSLESKLKEAQIRVHTLETILRTVAPSLVPLLMSSSSSSSSVSLPSASSANAASSTSSTAPQLAAESSADLASALLQNAVPAADVFTPFDGVAGNGASAVPKVGSNVDANGSSIVAQGYPLANQISVSAAEQPSSIAADSRSALCEPAAEAKASRAAVEAEAILSHFIDLDAKFANSDAAAAAQDQGASAPAASTPFVSVGEVHAAAAAGGALRSAEAAAGGLAGLSTVFAGAHDASTASDMSHGDPFKFNTISLAPTDIDGSKEQDAQQRFALLNSALLPSERSVWELATDAMLEDIYGKAQDAEADSADTSLATTDASSHSEGSVGSSPFDLVDLDIEIEEPMQLHIQDDSAALDASSMLAAGHHVKAEAGMDWPGLLASLVA
ncbi:uncharacterized protein PAN0_009c3755 [Moesziomyces antarcticus]|uniref:BZIP domain-containing protein n=1 Tax=Pseudozyma antarctica TaxID=84753 RepID=A0A081CFU2_PSEA2|nr:uncharacterized protein PAN0_009c3755 [Moesziomyces antarcticus]GAK65538.1 conserved hypothetical protein [Moesziomyces antarcticus]